MKKAALFWPLLLNTAFAQVVTTEFTARLTESGDDPPLAALVADAQSAPDSLTPAFSVPVPNAQAPRLLNVVNPAIAIPYGSTIRQIEAYWNGFPLPLIDPRGTELVEEAHSFGPMIPFFKPLFSVAAMAAGPGTLELRAFDSAHVQVASVSIPGLAVVKAPPPIAIGTLAAAPHPRVYLTPSRLSIIRGRPADDIARQRFESALQAFLAALAEFPDVTSPEFEDRVYDPESYIPLLALAYHLRKGDDPATANEAAGAAHTLTMRIANAYQTGERDFGRDTGYDIRFGLRNLMLAYDWMYDRFSASERQLIVKVATDWVDWYHNTPGYVESWPPENYYAGYLQGIALTVFATAGDNPSADRFFTLLRTKLANEVPVLNQRLAGGDWAEGWNYGPYSVTELSLVNTLLREAGEDWGVDFDWLQLLPRSLLYQTAPDFSETRSYGGYSGNYPHKTSPAALATLSSTTVDGAFASLIYHSMNANPDNDFADVPSDRFYEMVFAAAPARPDLNALPLSYLNSGTGRFFSRSSLTDPEAYFVSTENTSYSFDHYGYANGDVRLYHGQTCLVGPSAYRGPDFDGEAVTAAFSTYRANDRDQQIDLSRNNQNLFVMEQGTFAAIGLRLESSWASSRYDENIVDPDNPLDYLIREVVHIRPGTLVVRDLMRRRHLTDTLAGQWHMGLMDPVRSVGGGYQIGGLRVSTFYPPGVNISFVDDVDGGNNRIGSLMRLAFDSSTAPMELLTVFSEAVSATSYAAGVLTLSDGTQVTFAKDGTVSVGSGSPKLSIRRGNGKIILSWPGEATGSLLEATPMLAANANWGEIQGPFTTMGDQVEYSIPLAALSHAQFYRLRKP